MTEDTSVAITGITRVNGEVRSNVTSVTDSPARSERFHAAADTVIAAVIAVIEYAIVVSLLVVAGIILVRTVFDFLDQWNNFPTTVVAAIDGILVVIIVLDIVHTVFRHLRSSVFPVRPFLVIGILAGVRDILSSSAHLTLSSHLTTSDFNHTLVALGVGVGVVVFLLVGLLILGASGHTDEIG
jgi:uncharacterized membrane protein (DUF373 family)